MQERTSTSQMQFQYKNSFGLTVTADIRTATLEQINAAIDPASLPHATRLAFFQRKNKLQTRERVNIVKYHRDRLRRIIQELKGRAADDAVFQELRATANHLQHVLEQYLDLAKEKNGAKDFSEQKLVMALQPSLAILKTNLGPVDLELGADDEWKAQVGKIRMQVGDVLSQAEAGIRAYVTGACIKYRGSLATGWRNAQKSTAGTANRMNVCKFDVDAFVEIPDVTWNNWADLEIVTERERKGKHDLGELIIRTEALLKPINASIGKDEIEQQTWKDYPVRDTSERSERRAALVEERLKHLRKQQAPLARILNQLRGIQKVEEQLRNAMASVPGYKKVRGEPDFSFVLQTDRKSAREIQSGNLYPLEEIEKAGLPLTEANLSIEFEAGTVKVKMPEQHMTMSRPVTESTYPETAIPEPHTVSRPTVAMMFNAYLGAHPEQVIAQRMAAMRDNRLYREMYQLVLSLFD